MSSFKNFNITISVEENIHIEGNHTKKKGNSEIVVYVHGFAGSSKNITSYNLRKAFQQNNCSQDLFRFTAYSAKPEFRHFFELTMKQQTKDLESIINLFKQKYNKVHIFANSMGAIPAVMIDSSLIESIFLMDPAFVVAPIWANKAIVKVKDDNGNEYFMNSGLPGLDLPFCVSLEHKEEGLTFTSQRGVELLSNLNTPTFIASAGKSDHGKATRQLLKQIPNHPYIIHQKFSNADHSFSNEKDNKALICQYMEILKAAIL